MAAGFSGFAAMFAALVGILLYPTNRQRFIAIGLWVGYIAYGFTFPYNFITHDYYHLPIILVVAFGLIPVADFLVRSVIGEKRLDMEGRLRWNPAVRRGDANVGIAQYHGSGELSG